jgi:uncharacterized membrane protein YeaQ/YmgE (transglycosylase-associated protein family)
MSIVTWLLAGGLVGWTASYYLTNTRREAIAFNVTVAVLGAALAGLVVAPILGVSPGLGVFGFFISACGGAALLFCVHSVQQTMAR